MSNAPVVLFVYNRPEHTEQTVNALKLNNGASRTDLFVYSDAAKTPSQEDLVAETRCFVDQISGFKSVTVRKREENWGLAASIIDGVTSVIEEYGRAIVLEDDIVTSPAFLSFMNRALDFYVDKNKVWHISGWSYPVDFEEVGEAFLWRGMNCWGWATWADRWQYFEKDPEKILSEWSYEEKYRFDLDGSGVFWRQVEANAKKRINTWAIFWYATIFRNDGLCINPSTSYVNNIGHDGTGENCGVDDSHDVYDLNFSPNVYFPKKIDESGLAVSMIKKFYKSQGRSLPVRVINKINRAIFGKKVL